MSGYGAVCAATTSHGFGCLNWARDGAFCPVHDPRNQCDATTTTGKRCRSMKSFGTDRCSKHQRTERTG